MRPDGGAHIDALTIGSRKSELIVRKGVVLPKLSSRWVEVTFDPSVFDDNLNAIILCEPATLHNKHGVPIDVEFPPHICNGRQSVPGRYRLLVYNTSTHTIALHRRTVLGYASVTDGPVFDTDDAMLKVNALARISPLDDVFAAATESSL
jgi:hypothetical protein